MTNIALFQMYQKQKDKVSTAVYTFRLELRNISAEYAFISLLEL